ncbi:hypothetical protein LOD99_8624 [Oopsacas minuta]|uniref:Uncharacterized protein n=1 Tax=Oopsacas minuta TaxID=111878 RepID=A0AAV7JGS8_9METZ|nr:hypothetical protein LOD99_8624 [Oopsacas minuta]
MYQVHVTEFSRRDDLSKVRLTCVNGKELIFIMRLYDGCELGEVLQSYYSQRVKPVLILNDSISHSISTFSSKKSGNLKDAVPSPKVDHLLSSTNPIRTNFPLPSYQSTHLVVPQIWSYILVSPTQPNALHQFSPLNFPLKFSGRIRVSSSNSRGSGTLIPELLLDQCQQLLSGSPSETYFTDSFDEVTDSESEEYNLEVPTQFVKESLKKIHHIQGDALTVWMMCDVRTSS